MEEEELRTELPVVHIFTRCCRDRETAEVPKIMKTHELQLLDCPPLQDFMENTNLQSYRPQADT